MDLAKTLVVFIHGFSTKDAIAFWNNVPRYLKHDVARPIDTHLVQYDTSRTPSVDLLCALLHIPKFPKAAALGRQVLSEIRALIVDRGYSRVLLIGHSYGGLVATLACGEALKLKVPISAVCLAASPGKPNFFAILHSIIVGNQQTRELARSGIFRSVYRWAIPRYSKRLPFWYLEAVGDEVIAAPSLRQFTESFSHRGAHSWPREVERVNPLGYPYLLQFVERYSHP